VRRSRTGASTVAGVEWAWLNRLAGEGVACPRPIAVGEELTGSRELRSALLIEAVPGQSLERWMSEWGEADRPMIRRLIGPTADLVGRFHERGYIHRDLYLSHLFFDPDATPERSLHLIDLTRVIRPRWGRLRWIVKDLAALNFSAPAHLVSNTDRVRWLKRYLRVSKLDRSGRRLVYRVIGKTASIARHERRRQARFRSRSES
jgi:Ser/Thr protein kinase RdoA (MazF antagonist)